VKRHLKRQSRAPRTAPPPPPPIHPDIHLHYEAGWTDSWSHRRCLHQHRTPIEAAQCALPHGCGWYVFAVENGEGRELRDGEEEIVNGYRFGSSR